MIPLLTLIVCNLLIYFRTINFGLVMDDMQWYQKYKDGLPKFRDCRNLTNIKGVIQQRLYGGTTFGTNPKVEHCVTLFLHTLICCLMYLALGHNQISFMAALLYSCNPINNQTSIWLNGRRYAINIILVLVMILLSNHLGFTGRALAMIPFFLTGILQMTAIFSPILFGVGYLLPMFGLYLIFKKDIENKVQSRLDDLPECEQKNFTPQRLIVVVKSYGFYFFKMLVPGVCCMMYPDLLYWGKTKEGNEDAYILDARFTRGIIAICITIGLYYFIDSHYRNWLLFMALASLQWCNIIPVVQVVADRYVSLPNVFMMFFVSYFSYLILHQWALIILIPLMAYYIVALYVVMPMYEDIVSFYNYHIDHHPKMPWPRVIFIASLLENGDIENALILTKNGLAQNPTDYSLLIYGAIMSLIKGNYKGGMIFLDEAEKSFYIGKEKEQAEEIKSLRTQFEVLKGSV